jgi:hypothetical protein
MEVKFNVSESKLQEWYIKKLASMPVLECLKTLKDCPGVTSPDFEKSNWGNYTQPKQKIVSFELFKATKENRVRLEVRQRRGYKCFAFVF